MFLLKLHDLIKHNYENGLYSKDYSYRSNNSIAYQTLIKESFKLRLIIKVEKRSNTILNYYLNF